MPESVTSGAQNVDFFHKRHTNYNVIEKWAQKMARNGAAHGANGAPNITKLHVRHEFTAMHPGQDEWRPCMRGTGSKVWV